MLEGSEASFWDSVKNAQARGQEIEPEFADFLKRVLIADAPFTQPADLAWFLAAHAREPRRRFEKADATQLEALTALRTALEASLGLMF